VIDDWAETITATARAGTSRKFQAARRRQFAVIVL
jgi:hypothetical protein